MIEVTKVNDIPAELFNRATILVPKRQRAELTALSREVRLFHNEGRELFMLGLIPLSMLSNRYLIWVILLNNQPFPLSVWKQGRDWINEAFADGRNEIFARINPAYPTDIKFAKFFGFTLEEEEAPLHLYKRNA